MVLGEEAVQPKWQKDKWTRAVVRQIDTITLLGISLAGAIASSLGTISTTIAVDIILFVLAGFAAHDLLTGRTILALSERTRKLGGLMNALATNSKSLQPLGIETIYPHNSMTYQEAGLEITHSRDAFLLTRYFDAFNNAAVRNAISRLLQDGGACRLILYAPKGSHLGSLQGTDTGGTYLSTKIGHTLQLLEGFRQKLPATQQARFQYRSLRDRFIYVGILGTENRMYVTTYMFHRTNEECPTIVCVPGQHKDNLYSVYKAEFESLWAQATPPPKEAASGS